MKVCRRGFPRVALILCTAMSIGFLGLGVGCSTDDIVGGAQAEAVEAGLNSVLTDTVDPLFSFFGFVADLAGGGPARSSPGGAVVCPDMGLVCDGGGSGVCTVTGGGFSLTFDFSACGVVTGDGPLTLSGGVVVTPSVPIAISFDALVINGSPAMSGTGSVNVAGCAYQVNVTTSNGSVFGTIFQCETDDYPTAASSLAISFDDVVINITFNGSSVANAAASSDGSPVANCSINLATDPPSSSCEAP